MSATCPRHEEATITFSCARCGDFGCAMTSQLVTKRWDGAWPFALRRAFVVLAQSLVGAVLSIALVAWLTR